MIKKLAFFTALVLVGCATEKYVSVSREVTKKTNMIAVETVMEQMILTFTDKGFSVQQATVPVTISGSGVFISRNGHVLTCAHLFSIGVSTTIYVTTANGERLQGRVLYKDEARDLALVKVDVSPYYLPFPLAMPPSVAKLTKRPLEVGQEVIAVGNPKRLGFSVTHGIISYIDRDLEEPFLYTQTDAPINPGNSGGPLFNLQGELVGINALKVPGDGLGFAISPATIRDFLDNFKGLED